MSLNWRPQGLFKRKTAIVCLWGVGGRHVSGMERKEGKGRRRGHWNALYAGRFKKPNHFAFWAFSATQRSSWFMSFNLISPLILWISSGVVLKILATSSRE